MKLSDFDYNLPVNLIAQVPLTDRTSSRLMLLNKDTGEIKHTQFRDILENLTSNDVLVFNDSKVFPARLFGTRENGGKIEVFLVKDLGNGKWECLLRAKKPRQGEVLILPNSVQAEILDATGQATYLLQFSVSSDEIWRLAAEFGQTPLPPYIKAEDSNIFRERYQTVYAKNLGSVAAPTAGLHFNQELINQFKAKGGQVEYITLHVGLGTFLPVKVDNVAQHKMHSEVAEISGEVAKRLNQAKSMGKRVIAVGTTTLRALEAFTENGAVIPKKTEVDIFIYPGYNFKFIDGLITNFHLPQSTLLMLVSALAGSENIKSAYQMAIANEYRFFSFGDAMLII